MKKLIMTFIGILVIVSAASANDTQEILSDSIQEEVLQPRGAFGDGKQEIEFEGLILERLESPRIWSGVFAAFQGVRYKVEKVIKGPIDENEITVFHGIIGPPLCEKDEAILSKKIFALGNTLKIKAEKTPKGDYVGWEQEENAIVLKDTPDNKEICEQLGGNWERYGLLEMEDCDLPTADADKVCSDFSQCQNLCFTDDSVAAGTKTTGKCLGKTIARGTCLNYVQNGVAQGVICND